MFPTKKKLRFLIEYKKYLTVKKKTSNSITTLKTFIQLLENVKEKNLKIRQLSIFKQRKHVGRL